ncbi:MAG: sulfite exporter TauE/SafE family protein [Spirochaetaceae bacterium]|jgi:sulfite exporter TauE/SafE/copper chaperone CopZ/plastocyanin domain-containing protein|nr:sulfite exporter TauE/SafE family protein [Spirochaetaceae bacterium]
MNKAETKIFPIEGMTCPACETRIGKALSNTPGVTAADVDYVRGTARVTFDPALTNEAALTAVIEQLDYHVRTGGGNTGAVPADYSFYRAATLLAVIVALYLLIRQFGLLNLAAAFPLAETAPSGGTGYAALFLLGFVTSVHCIAMCGGINLSQCIPLRGIDNGKWKMENDKSETRAVSKTHHFPFPIIHFPFSILHFPFAQRASTPLRGIDNGKWKMENDKSETRATSKTDHFPFPIIHFPFSIIHFPFAQRAYPALLYNGGRVISYTVVGGVVGALGSVVSFSGFMKGIVQLIAGLFMIVMGVNMLGIFPQLRKFTPRLPRPLAAKVEALRQKGTGPLYVGLLNGLMPCGPLQAMQLYALSTGSPVKGALSMLAFALGTFPLTAFFGAVSSFLTGRFTKRLVTVAACAIAVMGLAMFGYGWTLSGFTFSPLDLLVGSPGGTVSQNAASAVPSAGNGGNASTGTLPDVQNGYQIVASVLQPGRYPAITVQAGIPVKWTITAPQGSVNGCNNRMFIREYGIEHRFKTGENLVEFTPERTGRFSYTCWMGMIRSSITVVEQGADSAAAPTGEPAFTLAPAGVTIPTDSVAIAEKNEEQGFQTVTIDLRDDGISPALIVVERSVPAAWVINNDSLDEGNAALVFPAYATRITMNQGENVIRLMPQDDFDFSTLDNVFYGYVKVVDDLDDFDLDAVKAEAAAWETQIYPEEYFAP